MRDTPNPLDERLYYSLFVDNQDGAKVLEELSALFYDIQSYTKGDAYATAYKEGHRAVIRHILQKLQYVPQQGEEDE